MKYVLLLCFIGFISSCDRHQTKLRKIANDEGVISDETTNEAKLNISAADSNKIDGNLANSTISTTNNIKIYNDVLNDLIYNHFYSRYLGESAHEVYEGMYPSNFDTAVMHERQRKLMRTLLKNKSKTCTIYLDKSTDNKDFNLTLEGDERFTLKVKNVLSKYSNNVSEVIKKLSVEERSYKSSDFHVKIAKVSSVHDIKDIYDRFQGFINKDECVIGIVSMSKIVLNDEGNKGILFYNFFCGSKCAKGELIEIIRANGKWKIVNTVQFWVS
jgi:hypothetical protein